MNYNTIYVVTGSYKTEVGQTIYKGEEAMRKEVIKHLQNKFPILPRIRGKCTGMCDCDCDCTLQCQCDCHCDCVEKYCKHVRWYGFRLTEDNKPNSRGDMKIIIPEDISLDVLIQKVLELANDYSGGCYHMQEIIKLKVPVGTEITTYGPYRMKSEIIGV